jgi:hypothetical protein
MTDAYEIMVTNVTVRPVCRFLDAAWADGFIKIVDEKVVGYYPGDPFNGVNHEIEIKSGRLDVHPAGRPVARNRCHGKTSLGSRKDTRTIR